MTKEAAMQVGEDAAAEDMEFVEEDLVIEEVSIYGMCGVY